jgi:hypothetical protein
MTEPAAKLPCEMSVVVKSARVGDLADGLTRIQQSPTTQQTRGMIQTHRMYEMRAGRAARREEQFGPPTHKIACMSDRCHGRMLLVAYLLS